jgi:hypothetical protein
MCQIRDTDSNDIGIPAYAVKVWAQTEGKPHVKPFLRSNPTVYPPVMTLLFENKMSLTILFWAGQTIRQSSLVGT